MAERRRKEGSLELTTSNSIVLGALPENKDPSDATVHCPNLLISDFTTSAIKNR